MPVLPNASSCGSAHAWDALAALAGWRVLAVVPAVALAALAVSGWLLAGASVLCAALLAARRFAAAEFEVYSDSYTATFNPFIYRQNGVC